MPSTSEPGKRGSVPSPADKGCTQCSHHKASHDSPVRKGCVALIPGLHGRLTECRCGTYVPPIVVVEHPNDECECGHRRAEHEASKGPLGTLPCRATDDQDNDRDDCQDFKMRKTALQSMVDAAQQGDTIRVHGDGMADLLAVLRSPAWSGVNASCLCGHAALVHTQGTGNCLAHGYSEQDDSHCLEFQDESLHCGECGHPTMLHDDYKQCSMPDCTCGAQEREAAFREMVALGQEIETEDPPEDRDMWFPGAPAAEPAATWEPFANDPEADSELLPASPMALPGRVAAYRVIYATEDGALHAIDVPYGVNASVIAGQLRLWHAGTQIAGITANITSVEEPSQ